MALYFKHTTKCSYSVCWPLQIWTPPPPPPHTHTRTRTGYLPPPTVPPDEGGSGQTSGSGYTDYDDSEPGDDEYYESGHESGYSDEDSVNSDNESGYYDDNSVYPEEDSVNYSGETQDFAQGDDKMSTTKQEHTQEGEKANFLKTQYFSHALHRPRENRRGSEEVVTMDIGRKTLESV